MVDEKFIDVDGVKTRYKEAGSGQPIVLIHGGEFGGGAGCDAWPAEVYEGLAAGGYRVIGIDRLGQAMTEDPLEENQYRISVVVAHAERLLDLLGVKGAIIVGQSRGAYVASRIAFERPDLVERMVIINSTSITPSMAAAALPGTSAYHIYHEVLNGDPRHDAEAVSFTTGHITDEWIALRKRISSSPHRAKTSAAFKRQEAAYYEEFEAQKIETVNWLQSGAFKKPTLVIWGIGDTTTSLQDGVEVLELFRNGVEHCRLFVINRCGHWPFREYPQEVVVQVLDFATRSY